MKRVSPAERTKAELAALFAGGTTGDPQAELVRLAVRQIVKEALEDLAVEMYARGLSTRDIEACFKDEEGISLLTRTAVSEVTERLWAEYEAFATRDLADVRPLYLFLDGVAERLRPGQTREAVLSAWGVTWEGRQVLIHLAPGSKESTECCREFLEEMRRRGLTDPVLVVTAGAPGLVRAAEECFPASLRQRYLAHKVRNIVDEVVGRFERRYPAARRSFLQGLRCLRGPPSSTSGSQAGLPHPQPL